MKIYQRYTNACLWDGDATTVREAVEKAVAAHAVLTGADLTGAVLTGADLTHAVLRGAVLRGAVLRGADLTHADLTHAVLTGADLTHAVLRGADLTHAVLTGADLTHADLTGADLRGDKLKSVGETASRSDGYEFRLFALVDGTLKIKAGCRWFTPAQARTHWTRSRGGTRLGDESLAIVDHLERMQQIAKCYR